ncbi:MAG: carbamoyltransferase C-terminal domain-containing protein [Candidatus Hydrogenedentota bacterium]
MVIPSISRRFGVDSRGWRRVQNGSELDGVPPFTRIAARVFLRQVSQTIWSATHQRRSGREATREHRRFGSLLLEEHVLRMAQALHDRTGSKRLCLAGGVALNCSMNGRLSRESPFEEIFVQPASGDDGIATGAALQLHHQFGDSKQNYVMKDACLGPEFGDEVIRAALKSTNQDYTTPENVAATTAQHISDGKILGWYQGRMEFGPRALGARSILADPTNPEMKDRLNTVVKHREEFRPFAPSCLQEHAHEYFEGCDSSPFMLFVYPVVKEKRALLPAITHVDGTARVQTVSREVNERYYDTIAEFEKLRGVPVVINTSFNVMGEPIVNTPEDAIRCFLGTGIDVLVLGDHIIEKTSPDAP